MVSIKGKCTSCRQLTAVWRHAYIMGLDVVSCPCRTESMLIPPGARLIDFDHSDVERAVKELVGEIRALQELQRNDS